MFNPINWVNSFLHSLGEGIVLSSYWICVIGGMIGLILYIFGYEKGRKAPMLSIAIYLIINIIGRVILGV